jgi:hypothetical protein
MRFPSMAKRTYLRAALFVLPFTAATFVVPEYARAQGAAVLACVKSMQAEFKISGDTAFAECNKKTLVDCIKAISDRNFVGESIRKEGGGYLIDLGNNESRWLEGGAWKSLGCEPHIPGPQRITQTMSAWNYNKHQWFRQAVCPQTFVELDQPIGAADAKLMCETNSVPKRLVDIPKKL